MNERVYYKSFSVLVDGKGRCQKFEINIGDDVANGIYEIVSFLKKNKIKGDFVLRINGKRIVVNKDSNPTNLVNEFFGKSDLLV